MGLILKNVSKTFIEKKAVDDISFELTKPGVFGLLGTNGAGKTTTIRMILGIMKKDCGEITWNGKQVERKNVNFGYLPEERGVYPEVKIYDQLMYFAELKGMGKKEADEAINKWAKELKVEEYLQMNAEKLSKGNQQKIQFMTAIIHDPELIILDEPFSGLDPVNTELLKDIIINLVAQGKYIIMSAHQMATIEEFCSDIIILNKGKTVLKGNLKEIKESYPANRVFVDTNENIDEYIKKLDLVVENEKNNELLEKNKFLENELLKSKAEFINYRKRLEEEQSRLLKYCNEDIIKEILPILDNFERAINMDDDNLEDEVSKFLSGFKMIYCNLVNILKTNGVVEIDGNNKPFNPVYHEAILTEKCEMEPGMVIEVLQKGYILKGKVIRPAMVKVSE